MNKNVFIKAKVLFGVVGWNIAETTRMIEIAKGLRDYECHFFSYGGQYERLVEQEGFTLHRLTPLEDDEKIELLWKVDRGEAFRQPWSKAEIRERITNELALIEELDPAFCFLGSVLTFSTSCKIAKKRLYNVVPLNLSLPYIKAGLPFSPFFPRLVNKFAAWVFLHVPLLMGNMNAIQKEFGVTPSRNVLELWTGDVNMVADIKELSLLQELPKDWYFSGPLFAHLPTTIPNAAQALLSSSKRKIYFAMGSSANRSILLEALQAFEGLDVLVIAPIEAHVNEGDVIPDNVMVTDWLPALEVLKQVDFAVTHGGQGTVQTTVMAGVPFVGIGMQPEQELNIYVYQQFGSAILLPKKMKSFELKQAIQRLMETPSFQTKAQQAKELLESTNTVEIIKQIIDEDQKRTPL